MDETCPPSPATVLLYAEDEENDFFFLQYALKKLSGQVSLLRACDGLEAKRMLGAPPAAPLAGILTDLRMPSCDGFELMSWLKTQPQFASLPVIALSTSRLERDAERCLSLGVRNFFPKPNSPQGYLHLAQLILQEIRPHAVIGTR
ncbi:MAG: response regulator [Opitutaceae bacterium]|nr:response regulator [Opitutaceae bacterium]